MNILAVGAHPDDIEFQCAGTLAKYVQRGDKVFVAVSTDGAAGTSRGTKEETARTREQEVRRSAAILGAEVIWLGYPDEFLYEDETVRLRYIELVRQTRPDVIITHSPADYHTDHNETSRLVFDTSFLATVPLVVTERPVHDKVTPIYYMDTVAGLGFVPTEFVDITEVMETKEAMLRAHESQLSWIKDHDDGDIVEQMKTVSAFRGQQCGVRYAEGFAACLAALRCTTHRLLP